jgi:hypothetical protein
MKKEHFAGAQVFQIFSQGLKIFAPRKKPSYAVFAEHCPLVGKCHMCLSYIPGCSWKLDRISHNRRFYENSNRKAPLNIRDPNVVDNSSLRCSPLASSYWDSSHKARCQVSSILIVELAVCPENGSSVVSNLRIYIYCEKISNLFRHMYIEVYPWTIRLCFL